MFSSLFSFSGTLGLLILLSLSAFSTSAQWSADYTLYTTIGCNNSILVSGANVALPILNTTIAGNNVWVYGTPCMQSTSIPSANSYQVSCYNNTDGGYSGAVSFFTDSQCSVGQSNTIGTSGLCSTKNSPSNHSSLTFCKYAFSSSTATSSPSTGSSTANNGGGVRVRMERGAGMVAAVVAVVGMILL